MFGSTFSPNLCSVLCWVRAASGPFLGEQLISTQISGLQKGAAERGHVKKRQKVSKSVKKFFDTFRQGQKTSKKSQKVFRHFSTIFARHLFSGRFWGALIKVGLK